MFGEEGEGAGGVVLGCRQAWVAVEPVWWKASCSVLLKRKERNALAAVLCWDGF